MIDEEKEIKRETAVLCNTCKEVTETDDPKSECDWCFGDDTRPVIMSTCPEEYPERCRDPLHNRKLGAHIEKVKTF